MINKLNEHGSKIREFYVHNSRMPSYSEMLALFGVSSKNAVFKKVNALVKNSFLGKDSTGRILPGKSFHLVRVLGSVKAGFPSPAEEELVDTMSLDQYLITNRQATYLLKVDGDSMIDAGIHPGDLVLIQRGLEPKTGDIIVAQVDGEWTLKYFERKGKMTVLRAANKKYPPIVPKRELVIAGVVIANIRKYK